MTQPKFKTMPAKKPSAASPQRKKILLVDDHPLMRRGQADLLERERDLTVCGEAGTARAAMEAIAKLQPDLVLVDMALPDKDGLELIKDIQAIYPGLPVLAMSMQDESLYAPRVLRAGGRGYVMKGDAPEQLATAIRTVLNGQVALSPRMSARMLESMVGPSGQTGEGPEAKLSDRELEVLRLIGEGLSTRQIAENLHISVKTVETYQGHLKEKLGLKNSRELFQFAIESALREKAAE